MPCICKTGRWLQAPSCCRRCGRFRRRSGSFEQEWRETSSGEKTENFASIHRVIFSFFSPDPLSRDPLSRAAKADPQLRSNAPRLSREANLQNLRKPHVDSCSGFLGVSWHKHACKWHAKITVDGKRNHLGSFATPEAAHEAYLLAKRKIHEGCTI